MNDNKQKSKSQIQTQTKTRKGFYNEQNKDKKLSKGLSWILRHGAPTLNLTMSSDGYIPVSVLLSCPARNLNQGNYSIDDIIRVVENNDKQRFHMCKKIVNWKDEKKRLYSFVTSQRRKEEQQQQGIGNNYEVLCIRANQGHSITGLNFEELLTPILPNELAALHTIIHGTYKDVWEEHIRHEGLHRMKRNHIHFAPGLPGSTNEVISGMRKSCEIFIYINGKACADDGVKFYRSSNGVLLTPGATEDGTLPIIYFKSVVDAKTEEELLR